MLDHENDYEGRGRPLDSESAKRLHKLDEFYGTHAVAKGAGVAKESIARAIGLMPLYKPTRRKILAYLREVSR